MTAPKHEDGSPLGLASSNSSGVDVENADTEPQFEVQPNGDYGWVCVACCATINAHTWGLNSSYGVFLAHYLSTNVFPEATRLHFAFVGGLSISQALLVSPIATTTTRLFGTRITLLIGVFFQTISLIGASFTQEIWQLFLTQGVCFGWGMGFLFVGSVGIVPQWFTTRRSLANGIATAGSGIGGLIYSLATNAMIRSIGLAWAFRVLGIVSCLVNFVCSVFMKDRNKQLGSSQLALDHSLLRKPEYYLLLGFGFFSMLGYIVLLFSLPNYAESVGLTAKQGSVVGAVLNLGQAMGRPPIGYFSDSIGRINMAACMTFLAGLLSVVFWIFAKSYGAIVVFSLLVGTVAGTFWATIAPVTAEVVHLRGIPAALSILWVWLVIPTTFSEAIALEITASQNGEYLGAQLFTAFSYFVAALCVWLLRAWKLGEVERIAMVTGEKPEEVNATTSPTLDELGARTTKAQTAFVKRMLCWKKI
ncbi:MFS general substrate transporter [Patellaria atrata CBS 101060]|uniref:MFS general substrate transporter n=1 Tax=Patellaria atrata CBS 101060 TaxID=1346257 RepID=A0A9P4VW60_9PEZI|nr:MFS general substrate transporter [Patellaria atrata CBS 101060]